jgi:hypothetical protein
MQVDEGHAADETGDNLGEAFLGAGLLLLPLPPLHKRPDVVLEHRGERSIAFGLWMGHEALLPGVTS